jgi:hypothetical protein
VKFPAALGARTMDEERLHRKQVGVVGVDGLPR